MSSKTKPSKTEQESTNQKRSVTTGPTNSTTGSSTGSSYRPRRQIQKWIHRKRSTTTAGGGTGGTNGSCTSSASPNNNDTGSSIIIKDCSTNVVHHLPTTTTSPTFDGPTATATTTTAAEAPVSSYTEYVASSPPSQEDVEQGHIVVSIAWIQQWHQQIQQQQRAVQQIQNQNIFILDMLQEIIASSSPSSSLSVVNHETTLLDDDKHVVQSNNHTHHPNTYVMHPLQPNNSNTESMKSDVTTATTQCTTNDETTKLIHDIPTTKKKNNTVHVRSTTQPPPSRRRTTSHHTQTTTASIHRVSVEPYHRTTMNMVVPTASVGTGSIQPPQLLLPPPPPPPFVAKSFPQRNVYCPFIDSHNNNNTVGDVDFTTTTTTTSDTATAAAAAAAAATAYNNSSMHQSNNVTSSSSIQKQTPQPYARSCRETIPTNQHRLHLQSNPNNSDNDDDDDENTILSEHSTQTMDPTTTDTDRRKYERNVSYPTHNNKKRPFQSTTPNMISKRQWDENDVDDNDTHDTNEAQSRQQQQQSTTTTTPRSKRTKPKIKTTNSVQIHHHSNANTVTTTITNNNNANNSFTSPTQVERNKHATVGLTNIKEKRLFNLLDTNGPDDNKQSSNVRIHGVLTPPPSSPISESRHNMNNATRSTEFVYHDVVRKQNERQQLNCYDCPQCSKFYDALRNAGHEDDIAVFALNGKENKNTAATRTASSKRCGDCTDATATVGTSHNNSSAAIASNHGFGRHRARFAPTATPTDFWELDFIDEC